MMRLRRARTASRRLPARDTAPGVSSCNVPRRSARESDERVGAYSRHLSQSFCSSSARDPIDREETRSAIPAVPTIISAIPIPCLCRPCCRVVGGTFVAGSSLASRGALVAATGAAADTVSERGSGEARGYLGLGSRRVRFPFFLARRTDEAGRTSPKRTGGRTPLATGITDWMTAVCLLCLSTNQEAVGG